MRGLRTPIGQIKTENQLNKLTKFAQLTNYESDFKLS